MLSEKIKNTVTQMVNLQQKGTLSPYLFELGMIVLFECGSEVEALEVSRPIYVGFDKAKDCGENVEILSDYREQKIVQITTTKAPEDSA